MRVVRLLGKIAAVLLSLVLVGILFLVVYVEINKESITRDIVSVINESISGEISIEGINFNPIAQFPHQAISLKGVVVSENEEGSVLLQSERIYLALNVISLFQDTVHIYGLEFEKAKVNLKRSQEGEFNIISVFSGNVGSDESADSDILASGFIPENIILDDVELVYQDQLSNRNISYTIDYLHTKYLLKNDSIEFSIELQSDIVGFGFFDKMLVQNTRLIGNISGIYSFNNGQFSIKNSNILLGKTSFFMDGNIATKSDLTTNITFHMDDDSRLISLFLPDEIDIKKAGRVSLSGSVVSEDISLMPKVNIDFGIENLSILNSKTKSSLEDINIKGFYSSGTDTTFSESHISIDTLYYYCGADKLCASFSLFDFHSPNINLSINGKQDLSVIEDFFKPMQISDMSGNVSILTDISGTYNDQNGWKLIDSIDVELDNVSMIINDDIDIKNLNGSISGSQDRLNINELRLVGGNSDYDITGSILQVSDFFSEESTCEIRLYLKSEMFYLSELLSWIPTVDIKAFNESFPYNFRKVDLNANINLNSDMFKDFRIMPEFRIDVPYCNATIDQFLPPVSVSDGWLEFIVPDSILIIDIQDFNVELENGKMYGGCAYYSRPGLSDSLIISADIATLNPLSILTYYDSISSESNNSVAGNVNLNMNFTGFDTLSNSKFLNSSLNDFYWYTANDTLEITELVMEIDSVYYDSENEAGPLSDVGGNISIGINDIKASWIDLEKVNTEILVEDGIFSIEHIESTSMLQHGTGDLVFAPFKETPFFRFEFKIDGFDFDELYHRLNQDPAISGEANAHIKLEGAGANIKSLTSSANGYINLYGSDLELKGLNLDNVIRKLNRTQNFSLADIGAIVVAGPAGLLVTKGSDLTSLLMINTKDSTNIKKLVSEWDIDDGELVLSDVAFSTQANRIAARGNYSLVTDSLNIVVAVVDDDGKIKLHQTIYGIGSDPQMSAIKPLRSLLKPVENLFVKMLMIDGDIFYVGKVEAP